MVYNVQVTLLEWGRRSHSRNSSKAWSIQSVFCVFLQGFFIKVWRGPMTFSGKQLALPVCGGVTELSTNAWRGANRSMIPMIAELGKRSHLLCTSHWSFLCLILRPGPKLCHHKNGMVDSSKSAYSTSQKSVASRP